MTEKLEPKLASYSETMYSLLIKEYRGKYFQNILSNAIIQIPEENRLNIHYVEGEMLSVWYPLLEKQGKISLDDFYNFALISEEQFKEYEKNKKNLSNILLVHENSKLFKEKNDKNKANLSARESRVVNIKDYKSKEQKAAEKRFFHLSDHLFPENSNERGPNPEESA